MFFEVAQCEPGVDDVFDEDDIATLYRLVEVHENTNHTTRFRGTAIRR